MVFVCRMVFSINVFYVSQFQEDHTFMLILRLRHNVIKTGLRAISLSYSRISLADVASKLALGSREDAEFIVAKAIRDGVIEVGSFKQFNLSVELIINHYTTVRIFISGKLNKNKCEARLMPG